VNVYRFYIKLGVDFTTYFLQRSTTTCFEQEILIEIQESNRNDYRNNLPTASIVIKLFGTKTSKQSPLVYQVHLANVEKSKQYGDFK